MRTLVKPAIGVIGAGRWGRLHAQKIRALPHTRLAAVIDTDPARAQALGTELGVPGIASWADAPPLDAVTIATPLTTLASVTAAALDRGWHVLAEKPLALRVEDAESLVRQADEADLCLRVGYLERFNPATSRRMFQGAVRLRRLGPNPPAAVLLDWMVHDLDLVLWRTADQLRVRAVERRADGLVVSLDGARPIRLEAGRAPQVSRGFEDAKGWVDFSSTTDALAAQIAAFAGVLRGHAAPALADGSDAVRVLRLVAAIQSRLR